MKTTIYTRWGSDIVAVSADWADAACQVEGDEHGRQVADFRHLPQRALRAALEDCAAIEGMDALTAEDAIDAAMEGATHSNQYLAKFHVRD